MKAVLSGMAGLLMGLIAGYVAADDWRLAGTLLHGQGAALIETRRGQLLLRSGERHDSCELLQVSARAARFSCDGVERMLTLGGGAGDLHQLRFAVPVEAAEGVTLEHAALREVLEDRQRLVNGVAIAPVVEWGTIAGYRLLSASPGSLADRAGFRPGDIMRSVNGVSADRGSAFMQVLNNLTGASQLRIGFDRDGRRYEKLLLLE